MTRLAVLADIHGNLPALAAVMADMAQFAVAGVVVAGDTVNLGPFSAEVLDVVYDHNWAIIRGNNELYVLDYDTARAPTQWKHYTLPPFLHHQLGPERTTLLATMPDERSVRFRDAAPVRVVHGVPSDPWEGIFPHTTDADIQRLLSPISESTLIAAHTHIPLNRRVGRFHIINPGSVGNPLDGDLRASYMVIEGDHDGWEVIDHRRIAYDSAPLFAAFEKLRYEKLLGVTGRLVIEEFRTARLRLYPFWRWLAECYPGQAPTDALVEEYLGSDIGRFMPDVYRYLGDE